SGRVPRSFVAALAGVVVLVVGLGAFFFYPSATVALTLREEPVGPMKLSVTVDPTVSTSNDQKATVPGVKEAFPVEVSGSFPATGENVVEAPATGTVTFSSENTFLAVPIPAGTKVSTASGIAFATTSAVTVPKAVFGTGRGVVDAPVAAVVKGLSGNVAARAITRVPADLASALVAASPVTNKSATTGGTHTATPMIVQADIDAAETSLTSGLQSSFQAALAAPGAVPSGSNLFSDTARLGIPTFSPDPQGLLNQAVTSFDLSAAATGTAVVADLSTVRTVAESRIRSAVRSGYGLVGGSITTQLGTAATQGDAVVVPVTALGLETPIVDAGQLRAAVQGRSVDEARTYLAQYGKVEISVSPGWASTMPSFDFRIDLQLLTASPKPTVGASPSGVETPSLPAATPSASPTGESPPPSPSPSPSPGEISPSPSAS
ncbi:MAG TPA: baseplate J/gp47 family protein, partial [Candidatus Limnocylindrales bacterium]|nr:baseplate J/gp47 family protein [Candidatus Limnocylindrales bacterium]